MLMLNSLFFFVCFTVDRRLSHTQIFSNQKARANMSQSDSVTNGSANSDELPPSKEELEAEFNPNDKGKRPIIASAT
jgi:hypothetical protein